MDFPPLTVVAKVCKVLVCFLTCCGVTSSLGFWGCGTASSLRAVLQCWYAPPPPPENLDAWKYYFQRFLDSIWALRTIKIKTILTIYYAHYNRFPQNLNHCVLEKGEMINLQILIQKNTFNVLRSCCPFDFALC